MAQKRAKYIKEISRQTGIDPRRVELTYDTLVGLIKRDLMDGEIVALTNNLFSVRAKVSGHKTAHYIDPVTKERVQMQLPPHFRLYVSLSPAFQQELNDTLL